MAQTPEQKLTAAQKRTTAVTLALAGISYADIASQVGCSKTRAHQLVQEAYDEINGDMKTTTLRLRARQLMRIDKATSAIWVRVVAGSLPHQAMFNKLAIQEAAIGGFKAPEKIANTDTQGRDIPVNPKDDYDNMSVEEIEERIAELEAKTAGKNGKPSLQ